jgi:hypothetical protein
LSTTTLTMLPGGRMSSGASKANVGVAVGAAVGVGDVEGGAPVADV